jgi:hypothetical protein
MELSEMFYTFLITTTAGLIVLCLKLCYKSKCKSIKFCGIIIDRDVKGEEVNDLREIEITRNNNRTEATI